jgi:hypothetical protein
MILLETDLDISLGEAGGPNYSEKKNQGALFIQRNLLYQAQNFFKEPLMP